MNNEAIEQLLEKNPALRPRREAMESIVSGAYCEHDTWGIGRIKKFDAANNRRINDFANQPGHPMAPEFCVDKLRILAADHILVRRETEPKVVEKLVKEDKPGLIKCPILRVRPEPDDVADRDA